MDLSHSFQYSVSDASDLQRDAVWKQESYGLILVDTAWHVLFSNAEALHALSLLGIGNIEPGVGFLSLFESKSATTIEEAALSSQETQRLVHCLLRSDQSSQHLGLFLSPSPAGILITFEPARPVEAVETAEHPFRESPADLNPGKDTWEWDGATREVRIPVHLKQILGIDINRSRIPMDQLLSLVHPDDIERMYNQLRPALREESRFEEELRLTRMYDGQVVWLKVEGELERNDAGTVVSARGTYTDITGVVPEEEILRNTEERFMLFSESFRIAFAYVDRHLRVQYHFPRKADWLVGLRRPVYGKALADLMEASIYSEVTASIEETLSGVSTSFELAVPTTSGGGYWIDIRLIPHILEGEVIGFYAFLRDKTDLKRVEEALKKSEEQTRAQLLEITTYFETAPVGLCVLDTDLNYIRINEALARINEHPAEAHTGRSIFEMIPGVAPQVARIVRQVIQTGKPVLDYEIRGKTRTGENKIWLESYFPVKTLHGEVDRVNIVVRDITDERNVLNELIESESRYSALFENNHSVMLLIDPETEEIVDANQAACHFYGYDHTEIKQKHIWDVNTLSPDEIRAEMKKARLEERRRFSFRHRLASGEEREVEVFSGPIVVNGKPLLYSIIYDVSERVRAETALRASEERFSKAFRLIPIALSISSLNEQTYIDVNDTFSRLLGLQRVDIIGRNVTEMGIWNPLERSRIAYTLLSGGEVLGVEHIFTDRSGQLRTVHYSSEIILSDGHRHILDILEDVTERKRVESQLLENERNLRLINATLESRVDDRTRELSRVVAILESRNKELQSFAYIASHDLQEPLRKVQTLTSLLRADHITYLNEEAQSVMHRIENAALRMSHLLSDVLAFSRIATHRQPFQKITLESVLNEVLSDLDLAITETGARIHIEAGISIEADRNQIRQLFNHLLLNALKFRSSDRTPDISVTAQLENTGTDELCILVFEDNGIGFEQQYADRIFEPFQRLHGRSQYPGTGMGLSICRRIVERHGGRIVAYGFPDEGSRFIIHLPVNQLPEAD